MEEVKTEKKTKSKEVEKVETEAIEEIVYKYGHVVRCKILNVRDNPSLSSEVISQLTAVDQIKINISKSTSKFYCIKLENKIGYSLKEYIELEED